MTVDLPAATLTLALPEAPPLRLAVAASWAGHAIPAAVYLILATERVPFLATVTPPTAAVADADLSSASRTTLCVPPS